MQLCNYMCVYTRNTHILNCTCTILFISYHSTAWIYHHETTIPMTKHERLMIPGRHETTIPISFWHFSKRAVSLRPARWVGSGMHRFIRVSPRALRKVSATFWTQLCQLEGSGTQARCFPTEGTYPDLLFAGYLVPQRIENRHPIAWCGGSLAWLCISWISSATNGPMVAIRKLNLQIHRLQLL